MQNHMIIVGAAGRDFYNFNGGYREDTSNRVVAFTAKQIPDIAREKVPCGAGRPAVSRGNSDRSRRGLGKINQRGKGARRARRRR